MEIVACQAAYESGGSWLTELKAYLAENMELIDEFLHPTQIKFVKPEGTYLAWLDFTALELSGEALDDLISNKARLWLNSGYTFGAGGDGFMRLNAACPRPVLYEALQRLEGALRG